MEEQVMEERCTEEMRLWLFDLAHGNLNQDEILKGFIKHYVLHDGNIADVVREIVFKTTYGTKGVLKAKESLEDALNNFVKET